MLFGILLITSCNRQERLEVKFTSEPLAVGDSALYEVLHVSDAVFSYSATRDEAKPVFRISDFAGTSTTVYALNPGTDTLWVGTKWNEGINTHGLGFYTIIKVVDK